MLARVLPLGTCSEETSKTTKPPPVLRGHGSTVSVNCELTITVVKFGGPRVAETKIATASPNLNGIGDHSVEVGAEWLVARVCGTTTRL